MRSVVDVVRGALKLNGSIDRMCFSSWKEFVQSIPNLFSVEVPKSVTNVTVGEAPPTEDSVDNVWFRRDSSGAILGIYVFQDGAWRQFYNLPPTQVVWMYGNSASLPDGFVLIDTGDPYVPSNVVTILKAQYIALGGGYSYFAVRWEGY